MTIFKTLDSLRRACQDLPSADDAASKKIASREAHLTKPLGSLGRLEDLTEWFAGWRAPSITRAEILVFAGNHGVVARGVSRWPSDVTRLMVTNFSAGGAAINQLAKIAQAELRVVGVADLQPTNDFSQSSAMDVPSFLAAVRCGYESVSPGTDLIALGEMGIGNTSAAAALCCALYGGPASDWVGRGAGLDAAGVAHKTEVIEKALSFHAGCLSDPLEAARRVGGYELAAVMGATLAARHHRIPVILDGFVVTAAAAPLARLRADGLAHVIIGHCSAEKAHPKLASLLERAPILDLNLRLGEGSGAALCIPILRAALACHTGMHRFDEAGIKDAN